MALGQRAELFLQPGKRDAWNMNQNCDKMALAHKGTLLSLLQ